MRLHLTALALIAAAFQPGVCVADEVLQTGPRTAQELEQFVSAYWDEHAATSKTPGLAIAFVQNGEPVLVKGYGVSNVETKKSVDQATLFRIGSVSKVFVGISAAQAIERGQVAPDVDINTYLRNFKVPDAGFGQITLRHLLTHSSGIDDWYLRDSTRHREDRQELGSHLAMHLPPRIRPPGKYMSYTNYGYALAAHVIEGATGGKFAAMVQADILTPLGMRRSGYDFGDGVFGDLATGYMSDDGALKPQPYTWVHRYPSTSMVTTAADMAMFVAAMTNGGCLGEKCILSASGRKYVYEQQFTHHKRLPGRTFGFAEWARHNTRGIWHDGAHGGFSAQLVLLPELKSGFFIAVNGQNGGLDQDLKWALLDRFFARPVEKLPEVKAEELGQVAGDFVQMRSQRSNLEKLLILRERPMDVEVSGDRLRFSDNSYYSIGDDAFQSEDGKRIIAIERGVGGRADYLFVDWGGEPRALERVSPTTDRMRAAELSGAGFALLILSALGGLVVRFVKGPSTGSRQSFVRWLPVLNAALPIVLITGLTLFIRNADQLEYRMGEVGPLPALLTIPFAMIATTALSFLGIAFAAVGRQPSLKSEAAVLAVSVGGGLLLLLVMREWSMIGWYF
ncbi:MAG: beta-lactamase family protein [Alphaproteobacteria bacterium]|nr:beta-lactamase family protein [Alphaproteobacteria bacterium]